MAYVCDLVHNVFIVRWTTPARGDSREILLRVEKARAVANGPLVYLAIVPEASKTPDDLTRREMADTMPELLRYCTSIHLVLEGGGLKQATFRTVAAGMLLLQGKRGKVVIHESVMDALKAAGSLQVSPETVIAVARRKQLVT